MCLCTFTLLNFKRKIWTWTRTRTWTSRSLTWRSTIELSWFSCQFTFKVSSWNNCHYCKAMWSMTLSAIYWSLSELTLLLNKYDIQIKLLVKTNLIISAFIIYIIKFQEKNLNLNRDSNSNLQISSLALWHWAILVQVSRGKFEGKLAGDSSLVERQARNLEVRVQTQVQIFLLKFNND